MENSSFHGPEEGANEVLKLNAQLQKMGGVALRLIYPNLGQSISVSVVR
jgi:fructose-specific phosphotransferase system IIC component